MKYLDFITPPKGYGNVPFYWWNGESLDIDRLEWQLEKTCGKRSQRHSDKFYMPLPR